MENKKERFNEAYEYLKSKGIIHTKVEFAKKIGADKSGVISALNGKQKYLTNKLLVRMNRAFNNIFDEEWLLTGKGDLIRNINIKGNNSGIVQSGDNNKASVVSENNNNMGGLVGNLTIQDPNVKKIMEDGKVEIHRDTALQVEELQRVINAQDQRIKDFERINEQMVFVIKSKDEVIDTYKKMIEILNNRISGLKVE